MANDNHQKTVDIGYLLQRSRLPIDPAGSPEWVNISETDPRRGAIHAAGRNARKEANREGFADCKIRSLKIIVTVDEMF